MFLFLAVLGIGANLASLREERSNLFVQTSNETIHAQRKDPLYRSEAQVKAFGRQWFKTAYTWNSKDPEKKVGQTPIPPSSGPLPLQWTWNARRVVAASQDPLCPAASPRCLPDGKTGSGD